MEIGGSHEVTVGAPPDRVMDILLDIPAYSEWWPGVSEATVLEEGPQPEIRLMVDTKTPIGQIELRARLAPEPPTRLGVTRTGGKLDRLDGGWTIREDSGGSVVRYDIEAEMDTGMPGFLEKPFREPAKRFLVNEPVEALKRRAES